MRGAAGFVIVALVACKPEASNQPQPVKAAAPASAPAPAAFRAFEAGGEVVAASRDGSAFVTRKGESLVVWSQGGDKLGEVTALMPAASSDHGRYAISSTGLLAEASEHELRVTRLATKEVVWSHKIATLWGPLAFSPDGTRLALLLRGEVPLLDSGTGRPVVTIRDGGLTIARDAYFSPDGTRVAIRCGTDHESPANHILVVANASSGEIVERDIAPHVEGISDAIVLPAATYTLDRKGTVRKFERGRLRAQLDLGADGRLAIAQDGALALVGEDRVVVWRAGQLATQKAKRARWPAYVGPPDAHGLIVIEGDGRQHVEPTPAAAVTVAWHDHDEVESHAWQALWQVAMDGANADATAALSAAAGRDPVFRGAQQLATQITAKDLALLHTGPVEGLALAGAFTHAGFLDHALFAYAAWMSAQAKAPRPAAERDQAHALGLTLASRFGDNQDEEAEAKLGNWMYRVWPDDDRVVELYARALRDTKPDLALAIVKKRLAQHASEDLKDLAAELDADRKH